MESRQPESPGGDRPAEATGAPDLPAAPATRAPLGNTRSILFSILLVIATLGLYTFYWTYKTYAEMKDYSGKGIGGPLGVVLHFFVGVVTFFLVPYELRELYEGDGQASPVRGLTGLWLLLPLLGELVWFVKVQGALNRYWESKGAPAA